MDLLEESFQIGSTVYTFRKKVEQKLLTLGCSETDESFTYEKTKYSIKRIFLESADKNYLGIKYTIQRYNSMINNYQNRPYWQYISIIDSYTF